MNTLRSLPGSPSASASAPLTLRTRVAARSLTLARRTRGQSLCSVVLVFAALTGCGSTTENPGTDGGQSDGGQQADGGIDASNRDAQDGAPDVRDGAAPGDALADTGRGDTGGEGGTSACEVTGVTGSLPGVRVGIRGDRCTFKSGEGGRFTYSIEVDGRLDYEITPADPGTGRCGAHKPDPLTTADVILRDATNAVHYCRCDVGRCAPPTPGPAYVEAGTYSAFVDWPGRQWDGPSDYNAPLGAPFPPGDYAFHVRLVLPGKGEVAAALPIRVDP